MPDRFFAPAPWQERIELDETESHHLARVLRAAPGDELIVFDGKGNSAAAQVDSVSRRCVTVKLTSAVTQQPEPNPRLVLAVASPKGERFRWLVEKATELGVDALIPLATARGVVQPREQKLQKLEQTVRAACKQCGRNRLMTIHDVCPFEEIPQRVSLEKTAMVFGAQDGTAVLNWAGPLQSGIERWLVLIGPEGGFTADEQSQLVQWGAEPISSGSWTLRVETAAIALAAQLQAIRDAGVSSA